MLAVAFCIACMYSCGEPEHAITELQDSTAGSVMVANDSVAEYSEDGQYQQMYVVVADTGLEYYALDGFMYSLAGRLGLTIDTMGRYYDQKKAEIIVPDSSEDEIWRGGYYPRYIASGDMSIEYYRTYDTVSTQQNIALVAGIFELEHAADSMHEIIRQFAPRSFIIKAPIYLGCMH